MNKNQSIIAIGVEKKNKKKFRVEGFEEEYLTGRDLINPDIIYRRHLDDVDRKYVLIEVSAL